MISALDCSGKTLSLTKPQVMGILNVTPDSFSDGGQFTLQNAALKQVEKMLEQGAAIIDVGGESTRPGAAAVSLDEELQRVIPIIEKIKSMFDCIVSIDTYKSKVMRAAVSAGAGMINDVNALCAEGAIEAAAELAVPVCLMHKQGSPDSMQNTPRYNNVTEEVQGFLQARVEVCVEHGIDKRKLMIDPGFGFGKTLGHNMQLMRELAEFKKMGLPVLVGVSRKSMLGLILNKEVEERGNGTVALETLALWHGASIIRTHDVAAAFDAILVTEAVKS